LSTRERFTDDEWDLLVDLPRLVAFAAMAADASGPLTSTRELLAGMMELAHAAQATSAYADSALIQSVIQAITRRDDTPSPMPGTWDPQSGAELGRAIVEETIPTAERVRAILTAQAPQDAAAYTDWVLGIARAGVAAGRSGLLGLTGEQVTARESAFLRELERALA
jgi:hypothetical protein